MHTAAHAGFRKDQRRSEYANGLLEAAGATLGRQKCGKASSGIPGPTIAAVRGLKRKTEINRNQATFAAWANCVGSAERGDVHTGPVTKLQWAPKRLGRARRDWVAAMLVRPSVR